MEELIRSDIETYTESHSIGESDVCRALREETYRTRELPQMVVGPLEGAFLKMVTLLVQAKRVLEIGMFTGYSALCFAEVLPDDGQVVTCEVDAESVAVGRRYFAQSLQGRKIDVRIGPALETLRTLTGLFDLIFIDADKVNYVKYYQRAIELLSPRGVILIDNVLWNGEVLKQPAPDASTRTIQELNSLVASDARVHAVLVTIRDGVLVVMRRKEERGNPGPQFTVPSDGLGSFHIRLPGDRRWAPLPDAERDDSREAGGDTRILADSDLTVDEAGRIAAAALQVVIGFDVVQVGVGNEKGDDRDRQHGNARIVDHLTARAVITRGLGDVELVLHEGCRTSSQQEGQSHTHDRALCGEMALSH